MFYGRFETQRDCSVYPAEHNWEESKRFAALKLPVAGMDSVEGALRELTKSHACTCASCPAGLPGQATRRTKITRLPPVLTIVLDRFVHDPESRRPTRRPDAVRFPLHLDMEEFLDGHPYARGPEQSFTLASVIIHEAVVTDRGFFYSLVRQPDGKWLKFDDERVVPVQEQDVLSQFSGNNISAAYGLLYVRDEDRDELLAPVIDSDIPAHISEHTHFFIPTIVADSCL